MLWIILIIIIIFIALILIPSTDLYKQTKLGNGKAIKKRVENLSRKLRHINAFFPFQLAGNRNLAHNLGAAISKAINADQITNGEFEELEMKIIIFSVELENITKAKLNPDDREELLLEFSLKVSEYVNQKVTSLNDRTKLYKNDSEKEKIRKRINNL